MDALSIALEVSNADRIIEVERRASDDVILGDFEGSVTGSWVRLDESGAGIVSYKGKEYKTKILGYASIPSGTKVELSYAKGLYYADF
tara:strand:- start:1311 stop:1574 length:264 start_codon:yes stop_codon:yes gene_type:complete